MWRSALTSGCLACVGWLQALKRETDPMSKQRRAKLEEEVAGKKEEERRLTQEWQVRRQGADEGRESWDGLADMHVCRRSTRSQGR